MKNIKVLTRFVFIFFLLLALACAFFIAAYYANRPVSLAGDSVLYSISRGQTVLSIAVGLEDQGIVRSAAFASLLTRVCEYSLKAGTYRLSPRMPTDAILKVIHDGRQESIRVTIPEGLSLTKTSRHLEKAGVVSSADFISACRSPELLQRFSIPGPSAEGFLFPDTYKFTYGMQPSKVAAIMIENFFTKIDEIPNVPKTHKKLVDSVILASIIEREYRVAAEAPLIASVFSNRLTIGMGLQSCSTIEYIITEIQGKPHPARLLSSDLEIPSDYNTYLWAGLPPGPISNPGKVALSAAFNPSRTRYLYFRLTDPAQGTHSFTQSLDEHVSVGRQFYLKKAAGN
ncbi:MAG TPA: endolytic transglycosylase MltG [Treponema sp.]|nr:endolytic transglycosylase MltG [Treponema sp.]